VSTLNDYPGRAPASREKRLDSVSAYLGEARALLKEYGGAEVDQRIRTFSQSAPDDLFVALEVLSGLRDTGVIIHGPRGCAASRLRQSLAEHAGPWLVTNLTQRETIMGADSKLRAAVAALYRRYRPKAIFIVATPPVAINNDDILSVVGELSEELGVVILPIFTSGFASKSSAQGYDAVFHSFIKYLPQPAAEARGEWINLLATTESEPDRREAQRLVAALGVDALTFPHGAAVEDFSRAATARLSLPLDFDAGHYLGEALQNLHCVPFLQVPRPIGLAGTRNWIAALGQALGKEAQARELHAKEAAAIAHVVEAAPLRGVRVYVSAAPATALGVLDLIQELGGEIAGLTVTHLDRLHLEAVAKYQERSPALQLHIGNGQGFEEINLLKRLQPQLYIGSGVHLVQAAQLGIPPVFLPRLPILGYAGIQAFAHETGKALRNQAFLSSLAARARLPYQEAWTRRSADWHIKQEVK